MKKLCNLLICVLLSALLLCLAGCTPKSKIQYISSSKEGDTVYVAQMIAEKNLSSTVAIYGNFSENGVASDIYGTGIIVSENGFVLTTVASILGDYKKRESFTYPVLNGNIVVTDNGSFVSVNIAIVDINFDLGLAILKITDNDKTFVPVTLETESLPSVGEYSASLVNAMAMGISAIEGYISKIGITRNLTDTDITVTNLLQVDIRANNGSFGGGLFNNKGNLTGIILDKENTANNFISVDPIYNITYAYNVETIIDYINIGNFGFKIGA